MTPERWQQIEDLCHRALALPIEDRPSFLAQACSADDGLRREVESLIAQEPFAQGFMSAPAMAVAAPGIVDRPKGAMVGQRLGTYTLRSLLGVGGMGEVYRAYDETLGREVAVKVLSPQFMTHPQRRSRFEREARMLATLNHPNVGAIYGVQDVDGMRALVLELVEGETLAERIARARSSTPMSVAEVIGIARQIADALDAAHEKGIVHRDLKPANVKITPDGVVKVLDFGLAKVPGDEGARADVTASHDGLILGTAAYMSPEQARSQPVDRRTDIWAFGCVLYEMLSAQLAFPGDTVSDTIAAILQREPDWTALPAVTPAPLRRVLVRCLSKNQKHRFRDAADIRIELDAVDEVLPGVPPPVQPAQTTRHPGAWLPWFALVTLAAAIGIREAARPVPIRDPLANAEFKRFTDWDGTEEGAEISPDGKFVAFLSDLSGEFDIWLSQVGSRHFSNITERIPALAPSGFIVRKLGFSDNGADIWFNPGDGKPLQLMPTTGGTPRSFLIEGANTPAWSPDGAHVAFIFKPNRNDPMYLVDRTFGDQRQIVAPGTRKINNPVWSPDGEWIYFVSGPEPQDEIDVDVWRVRSSGGTPEQLTHQHAAVNFLTMLDARTVLYLARADDWSGPWLWALDVDRKMARRVSTGVDQFTSIGASRDGSRIVATVANPTSTLWSVPLADRVAEERDAQLYRLPVPMGHAQAPRFGPSSLFYLSAGGSSDGLWKLQDEQTLEIWRNVDGALSEPPAISPDGRRVAVVVRREGKRRLSIMSADGTNRQTVAPEIEVEGVAGQGTTDWAPDSASVVIGGRDARGPALFLIPLNGKPPVRLVEGNWVNPVWSPDGTMILYAGRSLVGQVKVLAVRPTDGSQIDLPDVWARPGGYRFLPDGRGIVFLPRIHALDFWLLDLTTRTTRAITHLGNQGVLKTFDVTPDGKSIVFDRVRQNSDVVLMDLPK
jgi:Tol biopolymer transport system component/tRNA A-37 threonylcarbamoyl transferase component Bud32